MYFEINGRLFQILTFSKANPPLLTSNVAKALIEGRLEVSLDLGLTSVLIEVNKDLFTLPCGLNISRNDLELVATRDNSVFFVTDRGVFQVAISNGHYWKLVPTGGAPTLEIDGIRMHRTKDTFPEFDAKLKVDALGVNGGLVLDTCTGLGYTSSEAVRKGAISVMSVEKSRQVLHIARLNPWSKQLFTKRNLHLVMGDSFNFVDILPTGHFDFIIHDPPRLSHAGELYGTFFYRNLHRVLKVGGRLFHYIGNPGGRYRRLNIRKGVLKRLRAVGFSGLMYVEEALGVVALKGKS